MKAITLAPISVDARQAMQAKLDGLGKPIHGLGKLETLAVDLAGIEGTTDLQVAKRCCLIFAADHGVVREGVSATPAKVTAIQAINLLIGHTAAAAMGSAVGCELQVVDVGIAADLTDPRLIHRKIRHGTRNMVEEPAMTLAEAQAAIEVGMTTTQDAIAAGNQLILIGELGIGNTTTAAAILACALRGAPKQMVGRGSNISDQRWAHKVDVVTTALDRWQPEATDALDILHKVGGYEIAAKVGAILAAAQAGVPLIIDGFISLAAVVLAELLAPGVRHHVLASHQSREPGSQIAMQRLGLTPLLDLNLATGEGTGALLMLPLIDVLQAVLTGMNTQADLDFGYQP